MLLRVFRLRRGGLAMAAMATLLLGLVAACGGDDATPTSPVVTPTPTTEAIPAWQIEWDQTLAAAKEEGVVVITFLRAAYREGTDPFMEAYPDIVIEPAIGFAQENRMITERNAGVYSTDIWLQTHTGAYSTLIPAGVGGDTRGALIRPEVTGDENYIGTLDDHMMDDETKKFMLGVHGTVGGIEAFVNRSVATEAEFSVIEDLFKPEFKGRWSLIDPRGGRGSGLAWLTQFYITKGGDFVRQIMATEPIINTDERIMGDELLRGEVFFTVGGRIEAAQAEGIGLDVDPIRFELKGFAPQFEGQLVSNCCGSGVGKTTLDDVFNSNIGGPMLMDRAPNPNAAAIFLNWIMSRDGMKAFLEPRAFVGGGREGTGILCGIRVDVVDVCEPTKRLEDGKSYFSEDRMSTVFALRGATTDIAVEALGGR